MKNKHNQNITPHSHLTINWLFIAQKSKGMIPITPRIPSNHMIVIQEMTHTFTIHTNIEDILTSIYPPSHRIRHHLQKDRPLRRFMQTSWNPWTNYPQPLYLAPHTCNDAIDALKRWWRHSIHHQRSLHYAVYALSFTSAPILKPQSLYPWLNPSVSMWGQSSVLL